MNVNRHIVGYTLLWNAQYVIVAVYLFYRPIVYVPLLLALILLCIAAGVLSRVWANRIRKYWERNRETSIVTFPKWYGRLSLFMFGATIAFIFSNYLPPLIYAILVFIHLVIVIQILLQKRNITK
jgi:hypothetical protein